MAVSVQDMTIKHEAFLDVQIILDIVVSAVVATRLLTNYRHTGKLGVDDYCCILSLAFLTSFSVASCLMIKSLTNPQSTISSSSKITVACLFTGGPAMYFSKAPLLLFYIRIFGIQAWLRLTCYAALAATGIIYLVCALFSGINCIPRDGVYDESFLAWCESNTFYTALVRGFTSIFTDAIALAISLTVISKLHLPRARKIGLAVVFMSGIFAMAAACVALYYMWRIMEASSPRAVAVAGLCTCIECSVAIIVGCAPALHSLWFNYISKSLFMSSTKSLYQDLIARNAKELNQSPEIKVVTHHYVELGDRNHTSLGYQADAVVG